MAIQMKRCYIILFVLFVQVGCAIRNDPYDRYMPRWPSWKLKTEAPDPNGMLQYDKVYIRKQEDNNGNKYEVMRFWPTGQCVYRSDVDYKNVNLIDSYNLWLVGYYQMKGRVMLCQWFVPLNFGQYLYTVCVVMDNGDVFEISDGGDLKSQQPYAAWYKDTSDKRYVPKYIGDLKLKPDW